MNNSFAELVYRITGKVVDDGLEITTNEGTTYNFLERPAPYKLNLSVGKDAIKVSPYNAVQEVLDMTKQDKALDSVMVQDIFDFLVLVFRDDVKNLDINSINNRELKVRLLAEPFMVANQPDSDIVYNVLFYLLTNRTLYVRTFREFRKVLSYPEWDDIETYIMANKVTLAKYYRRNRSLLLYIKKHYPEGSYMRSVINRISKKSRKVNVPTSNKAFKEEPIGDKPTKELLKMLYASKVITVRNGLTYVLKDRVVKYDKEAILKELRNRNDVFSDVQKQLQANGWKLALPSSAKRSLGQLPNGSRKKLKVGDKIGVRWYSKDDGNNHVDLDLSMITHSKAKFRETTGWVGDESKKYGWNGLHDGLVSYSGDMTSMMLESPDSDVVSAYESFTINGRVEFATLDLSSYVFGDENTKVELIVGDELIPIQQPTASLLLGVIVNNVFYVYNLGANGQEYDEVTSLSASELETFGKLIVDKVWY